MQILKNSLKGLVHEKKKSIGVMAFVAIFTMMALLSISVAMSFIIKTFGELESFSPILRIYTSETSGASYTLVNVTNVVALASSCVAVTLIFLFATLNRRVEFKNYSLMGASFAQIAIVSWIKNIILLILGVVIGALVGFALSQLIGVITSTAMIFAFDNLLICFLIYLAFTSILSVVIPLWC